MKAGADGIKAMGDEAERFGIVIGQDAADGAAKFTDDLTRASAIIKGMKLVIGLNLIEPLNELVLAVLPGMVEALKATSTGIANFRLGLLALGLVKPKDEVEALMLEVVGLQDELKILTEVSVGAAELGVEGFRSRAEITAELEEKTTALTAAIERQAKAQRLATEATKREREEEEALARAKRARAAAESAIAFVRQTFGVEALSLEQRRAEETKRLEEQLTKLNRAFSIGAVNAGFFNDKSRELAVILFDLRRARSIGDLERALGIKKIEEEASAMEEKLLPALRKAKTVSEAVGIAQRALAEGLDRSTEAMVRNAESARRTALAQASLGGGAIATLLDLAARPASDPGKQAAGGFFRIMSRLRDLGFEGGIPFAQHGAVLTGPTPLIAGEAGRELVVPADRSQRSPDVQAEFERLMAAEGGGETTIIVPVNLDGREIARAVAYHSRRGIR